jgi:hypothetical protein
MSLKEWEMQNKGLCLNKDVNMEFEIDSNTKIVYNDIEIIRFTEEFSKLPKEDKILAFQYLIPLIEDLIKEMKDGSN